MSEKKSKVEELQEELKKHKEEKEEYLNGWKRAKADFENYKKEETERMKEILDYNTEKLILKLLPILDNFNLASREITEEKKEEDEFIKGLLQIESYFQDFLKNEGVEEMECLEKPFDPYFHEAVDLVESGDKKSGIVIEEMQKGYKINDKLLRPAKVKVIK